MRRLIATFALLWGMAGAVDAAAQDQLLDLRQPAVLADALRQAGYPAEVKVNTSGEPYIVSSMDGSGFLVDFYNCAGLVDCTSYQLSSWYKADPMFTAAFANEWNAGNRFLRVAVDKDGNLTQSMDLTATGKSTFANFADILGWYKRMDTLLAQFIQSHRRKPAK